MTSDTSKWIHVFHEDDEVIDSVFVNMEERWKESELSGDEWRFSYKVFFGRKGKQIAWLSFGSLEYALRFASAVKFSFDDKAYSFNVTTTDPAYEGSVLRLQRLQEAFNMTLYMCDQPDCLHKATHFVQVLKRYDKSTGKVTYEATETDEHPLYRQFCIRHIKRGDCGLDDADVNYKTLDFVPTASCSECHGAGSFWTEWGHGPREDANAMKLVVVMEEETPYAVILCPKCNAPDDYVHPPEQSGPKIS